MLKLGRDCDTGEDIFVTREQRERGMAIAGTQGTGKSSFMQSLIFQDSLAGEAIFVFDPHYDLIYDIVSQLPLHRLLQTYLLDFTDAEYPFSLNVLDLRKGENNGKQRDYQEISLAADRLVQVFLKLFASDSSLLLLKQLRLIALTLLESPSSTLADIPLLLKDENARARFLSHVTNQRVKDYWLHDFESLTPAKQKAEMYAIDNRLPSLLTNPLLEHILCQKESLIDFRKSIENKELY